MKRVKVYTLSTCSHCKAAKKFLTENDIPFEYTDVDMLSGQERADAIEEVKKFNARCTFPTILVGDKVLVGFNERQVREALGL
ncbi:MAG: bifunctional gluaredoxin/ribonucleoside-diphosphate reductase subunit beta [Syntrophaceae bacterium PtaU1.Bin231]|nr:MAG: bifunctional gluaredoxin/ribonucleoside-diphosphate reductase subunit beta [Syntrophaceae bacterium PtaU1.Bin231]